MSGDKWQDLIGSETPEPEPIRCYGREYGKGGVVYQILLESDDPRFKIVKDIYRVTHTDDWHKMGVTTDAGSDHGLPLEEARRRIQEMIDYVAQPGFWKELVAEYQEFFEAHKEMKRLQEAYERAKERRKIAADRLRDLLPPSTDE